LAPKSPGGALLPGKKGVAGVATAFAFAFAVGLLGRLAAGGTGRFVSLEVEAGGDTGCELLVGVTVLNGWSRSRIMAKAAIAMPLASKPATETLLTFIEPLPVYRKPFGRMPDSDIFT